MSQKNAHEILREFSPADISLCDEYYLGIAQKMVDFLNSFNPDRLLFNFRLTAGLDAKKRGIVYAPYNGWENSRIGGHTMGHYLTAAAQAVARGYGGCKGADGLDLSARLEYLVCSLDECQKSLGSGFIFGATVDDPARPELQFDKLEQGDFKDTWVPWYTMHKILAGLVDVFRLTQNPTALCIAENLGEWIYRRTSAWTQEVREKVLGVEFGGMNDCLYELYRYADAAGYSGAEHFFEAAHVFDEPWLFAHPEAVVNRHANTTIPKFVGALNRCLILTEKGEQSEAEKYLAWCENFWQEIVSHHTYITGGNSECEHFGLPDILDAERSNTNCETCNTYNMLKLSRLLFRLTKNRRYADYYENTFLNAIMASVNADNAATTYFQPMATGCFKTYCNPDVDKNYFWCCTGTGLENFTKLGDSFYFYDDDTLFVNVYVSSAVNWTEKGWKITQKTRIPADNSADFVLDHADFSARPGNHESRAENFTLALRLPDWLCGEFSLKINGTQAAPGDFSAKDGYIHIRRNWNSGDKITLSLPMGITAHTLQDNAGKTFGFKYGPVVLAAELGADERMTLGQVGAQCDVSANKIVCGAEMPLPGNYGGTSNLQILETEIIRIDDGTVADFMRNPGAHFVRIDSGAEQQENPHGNPGAAGNPPEPRFRLKDTDFPGNLIFSPYNRISAQRYGIYWIFVATEQEKQFEAQRAYHPDDGEAHVDGIGVGYGTQTEGNSQIYPHLQERDSVADPHELTRFAKPGGFFSYEIAVRPGSQNVLVCTFLKADNGKSVRITATGTCADENPRTEFAIADFSLDYNGAGEKFTLRFDIPRELTDRQENQRVRVKFAGGKSGESSARLCAPLKMCCKNQMS